MRPSLIASLAAALALAAPGLGCKPQDQAGADAGQAEDAGKAEDADKGAEKAEKDKQAMGPAGLGSHTSAECREFAGEFAAFERAAAPDLDPAKLRQLWLEGGLKTWAEQAGVRVARKDLAPSLKFFKDITGRAEDKPEVFREQIAGAVDELRVLAFLDARRLLAEVSETDPATEVPKDELLKKWDEAWCLWDATMRPLARRADASPTRGGEGWEKTIVDAFVLGRMGLSEVKGGSHDPRRTLPARQIIEKGSYALSQRLLLDHVEAGEIAEARALLRILQDRMADRNGPGLARLEAMLDDPHGELPDNATATAEHEIAVAFIKRARHYCDAAVTGGEMSSAEALKGAWEGLIYTRVVLPGMREALADSGFDADAYLGDWEDYRLALRDGFSTGAAEVSARLVEWNCAYQHHLGIAECTANANEAD